ncbi:hypothetical protein [Christensenella hongkongensis]|uniref:hypothetical protein n=1 Tax=Christensenella hongkongensis TaxID=270498 RepID=UPI0026718D41|nr:hypothetical protein [Christensenella hongkongensis]
MKRTKALVAVAMAAVMVFSLGSIALAAEPDIGQGAQSGTAESTVTLAMSETAPISISATVPITIPLAVQVDNTNNKVNTFAPTDCTIINNSKDLGDGSGVAIDITDVTASVAAGSTQWSLSQAAPAAATAGAYKLQLGLCGGTFGDLDVTTGGTSKLDTIASGYENIQGGATANLSVLATAGGTNTDYTNFQDGVAADIFKVQFTVAAHA